MRPLPPLKAEFGGELLAYSMESADLHAQASGFPPGAGDSSYSKHALLLDEKEIRG